MNVIGKSVVRVGTNIKIPVTSTLLQGTQLSLCVYSGDNPVHEYILQTSSLTDTEFAPQRVCIMLITKFVSSSSPVLSTSLAMARVRCQLDYVSHQGRYLLHQSRFAFYMNARVLDGEVLLGMPFL